MGTGANAGQSFELAARFQVVRHPGNVGFGGQTFSAFSEQFQMRLILFCFGSLLIAMSAGCSSEPAPPVSPRGKLRYETVHVRIDDATIASGDLAEIIEPVRSIADIYEGPEHYERSLRRFSQVQRFIFAIDWYRAEVKNGGHHQFYSNSTGIVWKDALEGFRALDAIEFAKILEESATRLGGSPSLERTQRNDQLDRLDPDFNDLDDRFYKAEGKLGLDRLLIEFIRAHAADFHFEGDVRRAVLPEP